MTRRTQVVLQDDIDGSEPATTVTFSLNGRAYQIDLSQAHAQELESALAPWIAHARRVRQGSAQVLDLRSRGDSVEPDPAEVRRWAQSVGIPVHARGRLPDGLRIKYQEAQHAAPAADS